jgi:hypothetical protein
MDRAAPLGHLCLYDFAALAQVSQKRPFVERFIVAADTRIIWVVQAS